MSHSAPISTRECPTAKSRFGIHFNNGGLPFIADTQAAVFYPPRWLTIGLSSLGGGWSYNSLQLEMTFHVLAYTLLMYLFVRRLTLADPRSPLAAFCAAAIIGYGGYTTGYPLLQLAVLEAAIWLPLAALGVFEATRERRFAPRFIALAGVALGMSWLAGHPQTSWFMTYLVAAYLAYRCYAARAGWRHFLGSLALLAAIAFGVAAVTLLPGLEYLLLTAREELGFAAKGNGFPIRDLFQFLFPGSVSQWSPLYVGLPALFFAAVAVFRNQGDSRFWLIAALVGLLHSLGENSAFYSLSYNFIPGLRFFRGQERAAFVVANSLAVLAGLGIAAAAAWPNQFYRKRALRMWAAFAALVSAVALLAFFAFTADADTWGDLFSIAVRSALVCLVALYLLRRFLSAPGNVVIHLALVALIAFELFSVSMDHPAVYDSVAHDQQLSMAPPRLAQRILDDGDDQPFRVDGFVGLEDNHASIYGLMDMRGISPLFLKGPYHIIHRNYVDNPLAWELFAVKYVFSRKDTLSTPTQVVGIDADDEGPVYLHRLNDPRPFARLYYAADVVDNDQWARELMNDPRYDERAKLVLGQHPSLPLAGQASSRQRKCRLLRRRRNRAQHRNRGERAAVALVAPPPGLDCAAKRRARPHLARLCRLERSRDTRWPSKAHPAILARQLSHRLVRQRFHLDRPGLARINRLAQEVKRAKRKCCDHLDQPPGPPHLCGRSRPGAGRNWRSHRPAHSRPGSPAGGRGDARPARRFVCHHRCAGRALRHCAGRAAGALRDSAGQDRHHADAAGPGPGRIPAGIPLPMDDRTPRRPQA